MLLRRMRPPSYPLQTVAHLRAHAVDEAVRGLARAVIAREGAQARREAAEQRQAAHEANVSHIAEQERTALERGERSAADLARAHAWRLRADGDRRHLAGDVDGARVVEVRARRSEDCARIEVGARRANAGVIERDQDRWAASLRKRAEAREEEAVAEAFRPKR
jgi:hypothetical protein